jgi:hypothetical protein
MQRASFNNLQDLLQAPNLGKGPRRSQSQDSDQSSHGRRCVPSRSCRCKGSFRVFPPTRHERRGVCLYRSGAPSCPTLELLLVNPRNHLG